MYGALGSPAETAVAEEKAEEKRDRMSSFARPEDKSKMGWPIPGPASEPQAPGSHREGMRSADFEGSSCGGGELRALSPLVQGPPTGSSLRERRKERKGKRRKHERRRGTREEPAARAR